MSDILSVGVGQAGVSVMGAVLPQLLADPIMQQQMGVEGNKSFSLRPRVVLVDSEPKVSAALIADSG